MSLYIEPVSLKTPANVSIWGNELAEFSKIRMLASGRQLGEYTVPENATSISIPVTGDIFRINGSRTDEPINIHFNGQYRNNGMWAALPPYQETVYIQATAGTDAAPIIVEVTSTVVQPEGAIATSEPLNGISSLKIQCRVATRTAYAPIGSVTGVYNGKTVSFSLIRYDDGTYTTPDGQVHPVRLYEATIGPVLAPTASCTIKAADEYGLESEATVFTRSVQRYTKPTLYVLSCYRSDQAGNAKDGGAYCKISVSLSFDSSISGNGIKQLKAELNGITTNLTSGQSVNLSANLQENLKYIIKFTGQDRVGTTVIREVTLPGALRDFMVMRGSDNQGAHVGVGMAPSVMSGKSSLELPAGGRLLLDGVEYGSIEHVLNANTFEKDFLNVDMTNPTALANAESNVWINPASEWSNYTNAPSQVVGEAPFGGVRKVIWTTMNLLFVLIMEFYPNPGRIWINTRRGGTWTGWKSFTPT